MLLTSNWLEVHSQFYCTHCIHFNHIVSWRINWFTSSIIYCLSSFFLSSSCDVWSEDPDELPLLSFSAAIWTENGKKEINVVQWKKVQTQQSKLKVVARGWLAKYVQATFGGKKINQIMNQTVSGVVIYFKWKFYLHWIMNTQLQLVSILVLSHTYEEDEFFSTTKFSFNAVNNCSTIYKL